MMFFYEDSPLNCKQIIYLSSVFMQCSDAEYSFN